MLMQATQRAAILTNEKFRGVRVVLAENVLKLIAAIVLSLMTKPSPQAEEFLDRIRQMGQKGGR